MSQHWKDWAKKALKLMVESNHQDSDAELALKQIAMTGYEPYHTLKGFVANLEDREMHVGGDE